jgi:hypothetical protein
MVQDLAWGSVLLFIFIVLAVNKHIGGGEGMKATSMWEDAAFLRHVIPPEEDRPRIYPSTDIQPRWFRSQNIFPIERHPEFKYKGRPHEPPKMAS